VLNVKAEGFAHICANAFKLSVEAYYEVLLTVIRRFKITKADDRIEHKLKVARLFPFADTPEQVDALTRSIQ